MAVMSTRRRVTRVSRTSSAQGADAVSTERADDLTVEAPVNLVVDDRVVATLMRTPGHDTELAAGWLLVESGVRSPEDLVQLRQCRTDDDLELRTADGISGRGIDQVHLTLREGVRGPAPRAWLTGSACGVCSADVLDLGLLQESKPHTDDWSVSAEVLLGLPDRMRALQRTFDRTGSIHAAALADSSGEILVMREDVGRHNAVDKVNGWALQSGRVPLTDLLLVVSGRVSFEIVQKAVAAGVAGIVAVSAPSDVAVDLARELDLVLAGMVREDHLNVYAGVDFVR
jgi:FdhD protein